ncbi:hypothetical protein GGER_44190 [Serratia rubidaea]
MRRRAGVREKHFTDDQRQVTVNAKIKPFHGIAQRSGADGSFEHITINNSNVVNGQFRRFIVEREVLIR